MCTRAPAITAVFSLGRLIAAEAIGSCQILCQENRKVVEQSIDADMATRKCTQGFSHEKQHFMGTFTQRGAWSAGREPEKKRIRALCKTTAQNKYTRFVIKKIKWSFNVALSSAQGQRLLLWLLWNKILIVMTLAVSFSALYKSECYRKKKKKHLNCNQQWSIRTEVPFFLHCKANRVALSLVFPTQKRSFRCKQQVKCSYKPTEHTSCCRISTVETMPTASWFGKAPICTRIYTPLLPMRQEIGNPPPQK